MEGIGELTGRDGADFRTSGGVVACGARTRASRERTEGTSNKTGFARDEGRLDPGAADGTGSY